MLERLGYDVFNSIFTQEEVAVMRNELYQLLPSNDFPYKPHYSDDFFNTSLSLDIFANDALQRALRSVHGPDPVILPEFGIHDSVFGGWHTDMTSAEAKGKTFHKVEDFGLCQWAIYLQPNGKHGGGLSAIAGSHKLADPYVGRMIATSSVRQTCWRAVHSGTRVAERVRSLLTSSAVCRFAIPHSAGDVVAFDLRIRHRATPWKVRPVEMHSRKLAIFFVAGRNNEAARHYREWLEERSPQQVAVASESAGNLRQLMQDVGITLL